MERHLHVQVVAGVHVAGLRLCRRAEREVARAVDQDAGTFPTVSEIWLFLLAAYQRDRDTSRTASG
ncbi:hypothetical protein AV521_18660 [Streptomyces sp. IMTB 2501]|nr:hypothetical protein AV521_18660 [Streptomyces sp. IMTB 2501]